MTGSKAVFGWTGIRMAIGRFVSQVRSERPWYDTHLPLIPVPIQPDRFYEAGSK